MSDAMREAAINRVAEHLNEIKQCEESDRDHELENALDVVLKQAALEHAGQPPAPAVPDELFALLRDMVDLHDRREVVLTSHMEGIKELLEVIEHGKVSSNAN